jgi:hypothetical protein
MSFTACSKDKFELEGKWQNVGGTTFGVTEEDSVVTFGTNKKCNLYVVDGFYSFGKPSKKGNTYELKVGDADTVQEMGEDGEYEELERVEDVIFTVEVIDNDNIKLSNSSVTLTLKRI